MAKHFSKKYGNRDELSNNYNLKKSYVEMPVGASCYIPTSLPQESSFILYYLELNSGIGH